MALDKFKSCLNQLGQSRPLAWRFDRLQEVSQFSEHVSVYVRGSSVKGREQLLTILCLCEVFC
jgi:hypothetical protein